MKEAGADCVKILLYYTPFDPKEVNDTKHAWVERIGDECRGKDIPFFLEFVGYEEGADEKGFEYAKKKAGHRDREHARIHQDRIWRGRAEGGSAGQHGVRGGREVVRGQKAYTKKEAIDLFHKAARSATKPFIYFRRA